MIDGRFPEALQGQSPGFFASVMHGLGVMLIWLLPAGCVFLLTLWAVMIYKALGGRVTLETALGAALRLGLAVYLFLPLYVLPFFILGNQNAAGITGLCLDGLVLVLGVFAAARLIRRARTATVEGAPTQRAGATS